MLPSDTSEIAGTIQKALAEGNFQAADPLILEFSKRVRRQISASANDEQRLELTAEALRQMDDLLHLSRVIRSHISSALHSANAESQYLAYGYDRETLKTRP